MSFTITILEPSDRVRDGDYFRPLSIVSYDGDTVHTFSTYSGRPENHCRWVPVFDVLGRCYSGKTVAEINRKLSREYEFIRGPIHPQLHWDWRAEK